MDSRTLVLSIGLISLGACGGDSTKGTTCGAGTMLEDGTCVGTPGPTCGSGTTLQNGMCIADPSTPTTCGPGTTMQGDQCVVDTAAPGPVTGLTASVDSGNISLTWTAGANSASSLVVRTIAGAYDAPAPLTTYTAGMTLPGGATVVAAGSATTATDPVTAPGRYTYLVYPQSASGVYGFPRVASTVATIPAQTGSISIDVAGAAATVTAQPANVSIAVANVAYDAGTSTATVDVTLTQNTAGQLYNLKATFGAPSVGAVQDPTGTTTGGDPFVTFAPAATLPGTAVTSTITIAGVANTDTVTLPITVTESGLGIMGSSLTDLGGGQGATLQLPALRGRGNAESVLVDAVFDASGRYAFGVTRWSYGVFRVDTATGDVTAVAPSSFATGSGSCIVAASDGYLYATFALGAHRHGDALGAVLARIDPVTMTIVATTDPLIFDSSEQVRGCAVHGTTLAVAVGPSVYFGDLATLAFTDADANTPDVIDPVTTPATRSLMQLAFSPDGMTVYANEQQTGELYAVDVANHTGAAYHTASDNVWAIHVDDAGVLWWGQNDGLYSFDGTTETQAPGYTGEALALVPLGGTKFLTRNSGATFTLDSATGELTNMAQANSSRPGHSIAVFATP